MKKMVLYARLFVFSVIFYENKQDCNHLEHSPNLSRLERRRMLMSTILSHSVNFLINVLIK